MSDQNKVLSGDKFIPYGYEIKDFANDESISTVYNFINGKYQAPISGKYFCNVNPAKSKVYAHVACSDERDVNLAIKAAKNAFKSWSAKSEKERAKYLLKIADEIEKRVNEFALLESLDVGKSLHNMAKNDILGSVEAIRFFASQVQHHLTEAMVRPNETVDYIYRKPLGVVASITPWNFPFFIVCEQIAPAIVYGNTIICKPSELTPMTANLLASVLRKVNLPPGVVNIVNGFGHNVGQPLCTSEDIRAVCFVGGTVTGRKIHLACAPTFKKVKLEMGGKNVSIVFDDIEDKINEVVMTCAAAAYSNSGQICVCGSRLYVQKKIYDKFVEKFVQVVKNVWTPAVGNQLDKKTLMGPLVSIDHRKKTEYYIELAKQEGENILVGGSRPTNLKAPFDKGSFYMPTVITGLPVTARCATEEIFGPVVTIHPFETEKEVVGYANMLNYGLAGSLFSSNIQRAHRVAQSVETGRMWVNHWGEFESRMPFGGVKHSGIGRQGGLYSRDFFTMCKHISCKL